MASKATYPRRSTRRPPARARRGGLASRPVIAAALVLTLVGAGLAVSQSDWWFRLFHPLHYRTYISTHARNYDLPPDLLAAVVYEESRFDPHARSGAGAVGLMQLTPATARGIAIHTGGTQFHVSDLDNPELNMRYGSFYLQRLHTRLDHGDRGYTASLAAYNAGQGKVAEWLAHDADHQLELGEIRYRETRAYVSEVQSLRGRYRSAYHLGRG